MTYIVCERIIDMPTPPVASTRRRCGDCEHDVWLSLATEADGLPGDRILCIRCTFIRSLTTGGVAIEPPGPFTQLEVDHALRRDASS